MQVFVIGHDRKISFLDCTPDSTILQLKQDWASKVQYDGIEFELFFDSNVLDNEQTVRDSNVRQQCYLEVYEKLLGGA
jgi:hypothetical protein